MTTNQPIVQRPSPPPENGAEVIVYFCKVAGDGALNIRTSPEMGNNVVFTCPSRTTLNFFEVVYGEDVNGNPLWGHSVENHFYWMGGTDHPNG